MRGPLWRFELIRELHQLRQSTAAVEPDPDEEPEDAALHNEQASIEPKGEK